MYEITATNLCKSYKGKSVLSDFSFAAAGEIIFLAGRNGAGKTTFIRIALGLDRADSGGVRFQGAAGPKPSIGVVFDTPTLYEDRTCLQNIVIACGGRKPEESMFRQVTEALELGSDLLSKRAGSCSFGQKHRLAVAIALLQNPDILFLDEPTVGMDPLSWELVREALVQRRKEQGGTILITGQDYGEMQQIADRVVILHHGRAAFDGSVEQLLQMQGTDSLKEAVRRVIAG